MKEVSSPFSISFLARFVAAVLQLQLHLRLLPCGFCRLSFPPLICVDLMLRIIDIGLPWIFLRGQAPRCIVLRCVAAACITLSALSLSDRQ